MTPDQLRARTKQFAIQIVRFSSSLRHSDEARVIRTQLIRSGTAVGANYRAVCRSRSNRDFIAKLGIAIEEVDETSYWLEVLVEAGIVEADAVRNLLMEADELTRIFVSSRQTARRNTHRTLNP